MSFSKIFGKTPVAKQEFAALLRPVGWKPSVLEQKEAKQKPFCALLSRIKEPK